VAVAAISKPVSSAKCVASKATLPTTATSSSYGVDTNWYMDTRATDHITGELEKLTIRDRYNGNEQVHAANGAGMDISHVGHSILQSPHSQIDLKNILHVPKTNKSLVSVHRLARDNNAFLEFHPNHFSSRSRGPRGLFFTANLKGASILSSSHQINKHLAPSSPHHLCGMLD
jgi:histone deacetylase 1/2